MTECRRNHNPSPLDNYKAVNMVVGAHLVSGRAPSTTKGESIFNTVDFFSGMAGPVTL